MQFVLDEDYTINKFIIIFKDRKSSITRYLLNMLNKLTDQTLSFIRKCKNATHRRRTETSDHDVCICIKGASF